MINELKIIIHLIFMSRQFIRLKKWYINQTQERDTFLGFLKDASDFARQHRAFRNAMRIGYATKRTVIAPMLRLGKHHNWTPFEEAARLYEAQDKNLLRRICATEEQTNESWRTKLEPCETMHEWTEVPWSSIFDLAPFKTEFNITILERVDGHGWGTHESVLGRIPSEDVVVVDPLSFETNGTEWDTTTKKPPVKKTWYQRMFAKPVPQGRRQLKRVMKPYQIDAIKHRFIQFGDISSSGRFQTRSSPGQTTLNRAMMKHLFLAPDQLKGLKVEADKVIATLGGPEGFNSLHLSLNKLVAMDSRFTSRSLEVSVADLDAWERKELMNSVMLELVGDIPIDQAVSAAMPIRPSWLKEIFNTQNMTVMNRRPMLDACLEYRQSVDPHYPIHYLVNDVGDPEAHIGLFRPLFELFPCTFSLYEINQWRITDMSWTRLHPELKDTVDYATMFEPILDILVASKGYSFFEMPETPLTRLIAWQPK
ncbi:hypothetical protein PHYBLDRAFT_160992 [Phycomyces blakesleeanus NRRL 1555(-)]|uniref:Uncharacterized protein n=2 Tax=Phycomyces blakesleeanus TaxID=4837 RepID=A0A162V6F9_PHYB8|nr:hypothetical protein PHYBLDRAFT_160992 [Phycomyces blakesleeanus NRRL 1555(-)]OAD80343.1 hypothetical protein PHYBLDRAFT_160992 [Phycomyces blakesleeanus NRRL 1555(-)]|eukprot:XP_018298383.1 hypothetical protein PHYBLDRAFT_160992 [Phycomyces blakesleeanus NRRL 1555(-)]